ncbi:MAG: Outer membrane protein D1 [Candidatus Accumulibacter regalis]|jgi:porin|uniref:Outer membrane protein D1 n=1 Tax=Accumulibacter regalis TaxID=522306 RepID=A0A011PJ13_ACCRE|nr:MULTISPECIES: carbohydrate porin [unclassified Candidatus Accumulibacter]EXI87491.1 MAG: Outer membrane protein D1 [Candidatus Accumulibacter regalis]HRE70800.1 carbohydrate porin [Accumulibacter sp.]HRE85901.1 carbohydrate porin [Accumulibacter sp.]HRI92259.1 carbohydrate porin [Accumulibacter sp.]
MRSHHHSRQAALAILLLGSILAQPWSAMAATATGDPASERQDELESEGGPAREATMSGSADGAAPDWQESTLSGDWNGARQRLYDAGVGLELLYTADYLRNNSGGLKRGGGYMGHVDLIVHLDGERLLGWQGGMAYLQVIANSGARVNLKDVGSLMGVDNIEAPVNRSGIFQAWLQQSFADDKASLRLGLYPIDSEFYVTDSSSVFLHPSFGMSAEAGDFGTLAGPSIYPTSTWGARLRVDPDPAWYAMLALTRGVPTDRAASAGPNISWQQGSGSMLIGEVGLRPAELGVQLGDTASVANAADGFAPISKLALGAWRFTPQFPELVAVDAAGDAKITTHWGAYALGEQTLYRVPDSSRHLSAFLRYGVTDGKTNNIDYSLSAGISWQGVFAGREDDVFGIAATRAHVGPQGRQLLAADLDTPLSSSSETVVEVTYKAQLARGVIVQPLIQRILNPGLSLPDATVAGARLQLAF